MKASRAERAERAGSAESARANSTAHTAARPGRPWLRWSMLGAAAIVAVTTAAAYAQNGGDGGASGGIDLESGTFGVMGQLFMTQPWINGLNLLLSIGALSLFGYFLMTINSRAMVPADFVDEVTKLVVRGKHEAASDLCRAHRQVFIATIVQRCVDNAGKGHSVIMEMLDTEGRRRADIVWNRISYLADVSNVAPMLGLLGTVIGMIQAFFSLNLQDVGADTAGPLSQGVAAAMSTTMFGLMVGIMALVFYSIVKARATRTLAEAEAAVHSITDHLKREAD